MFCYHDPDLDYHLSRVQKVVPNCDNGYSYPAPALQFSTGVKYAAPAYIPPVSAPTGYASGGYTTGVAYQAPKITYAAQPAATYQTSPLVSNYATASNEVHGYATSEGLSSATSQRPITPITTYAQAPIIAKVTGSPLIAKYALAPAKTTYTTHNLIQQGYSGSLAKASLNSYGNVHAGGPVVSQVFAAPSVRYTAAPALNVQAQQISGYNVATPGIQYAQAANVAQYATSSRSQISAPAVSTYFRPAQKVQYAAPVAQYAQSIQYAPPVVTAPAVTQYSAPTVAQYSTYSAPSVAQYATQRISSQYSAPVTVAHPAPSQYAAPAVTQYAAPASTQYAAPAVAQYAAPTVTQYAAPTIAQYAAPAVAHYSSPAVATVSQYSAPASVTHHVSAPAQVATAGLAVKNAHTEFLENYVSTF